MIMDNKIQTNQEQSLDFSKLIKDIMKHKKRFYTVLGITFVVSCILMLSIPNYYKCEVMLAPELSRAGSSNSLLSLANSFGMRIGTNTSSGEALFPTLYPEMVNSTDFKTSLFRIPVHKQDSTRMMTYYDYLLNEQKYPWWSEAISGTLSFLVSLIATPDSVDNTRLDPFQLTKQQKNIADIIEKKVSCDVDAKTLVITIDVYDQDPLIAATMADSVKTRLQRFITDYRTRKARVDLDFNRKLFAETKARYEKARRDYAAFADANQDIILESVRGKRADLENEMQLRYNAYTQVATQLQAAEAKVQEDTPAFTTIQRATVPVKKAGPARAKRVLIFLFLAFICTTVWAFHKEGDLKPLLGL
ncbi:MAG: chain-length determining protein [Prevotella sp.]|nr:chain-length determining protein [Prevotella sp.]